MDEWVCVCYWAYGEVGGQVMRTGENEGGYWRAGGVDKC